ncbi:hypothetical protein [Nocardia wallacei]|uniref:hypothetical protein n=1 Tax=Nocardia wallacei TaxID=480035 RepID=UPI002458B024|nr:hypothetical protein [Nocardia wallacei]
MKGIEEALIFDDSDQLPNFGPPFMAHAPASSAPILAPLTRSHDVGAVITTCSEPTAKEAIRVIRKENARAAILLDAERYRGGSRGIGARCMTTDWINMQTRIGLRWALTDSGYIPAGDLDALRAVLAWGAGATQVITALPLAIQWLTVDRDLLIAELTAAVQPVALMLESKGDPLAAKEAVTGLIAVLRCPTPMLLLRSDTSVLGALAHGAAAVSVGTKSGLRHIYPIAADDDNGFIPPPCPSAYVPALKSYKRLTTIEDGITRNPDLDLWRCNCSVCHGRSIAWIVFAADPESAAFEHSLAAQSDLARALLARPPATRGSEWKMMCARAQVEHDRIVKRNDKTWEPADALSAWVSSTPHPQASTP